jgi:DNA-binding MurR/RpiR family transcriptional regulator
MDVLEIMTRQMDMLTRAQRKAADYIIKNTVQSAFSTVGQLAQAVGISTNSIVRLALDLGYTGYSDFSGALQEVVMARESPAVKLGAWASHRGDGSRLIEDVTEAHARSIGQTLNQLSHKTVYKAAKMIASSRHVYISGGRTSYGIAYVFMHCLNRLTGKCDLLNIEDNNLPEKISRIQAGDIVVVICMPRYLNRAITVTKLAKKQGAKIITITDSHASPFQPLSDILFLSDFKGVSFFNSMLSSLMIVEIIISVVADMSAASSKTYMDNTEQISQKIDLYHKL